MWNMSLMTVENLKYIEPLMLLSALAGHRWLLSLFRKNLKINGGPLYSLALFVLVLLPIGKVVIDWVVEQYNSKTPFWNEMNQILLGYFLAIFLAVIAGVIVLFSNRYIRKNGS